MKPFYIILKGSVSSIADRIEFLDFESNNADKKIYGAAITLAYSSPAGPREFSVLRSNQFRDYMIYINFGYNFFNR